MVSSEAKFEKLETSEETQPRQSTWVKDTADDIGTKQVVNWKAGCVGRNWLIDWQGLRIYEHKIISEDMG